MSEVGARGKRPSMADVGRIAQVSAQTVSRMYTGGYVSADSRQRIELAVRQLGYKPNRLPGSLRGGRTRTIGFLSMGPLNYGNAGILTGIGRRAHLEGQTLLTSQFDLDAADPATRSEIFRALDNFVGMRVDGIVVATPYIGVDAVTEYIGDDIPVVSLSELDGSVHADSYGAARQVMAHLIELGHRRILHLAGPANRNEAGERARGYRDAMDEAALEPLPLEVCAEWDARSGALVGRAVDPNSFTAVFAADDEIALGFISQLRSQGLEPPRDYSIAGVDDMPESRYFAPPLTTARLDFEQLGEIAMRLLLDRIEGRGSEQRGTLSSVLEVRESTGAPAVP